MTQNIYYCMDGNIISDEMVEKFKLETLVNVNGKGKKIHAVEKLDEGWLINFVGFIFNPSQTLVSFPKNYIRIENLDKLNQSDVKLLADVLFKYNANYLSNHKRQDFNSHISYPFNAYHEILKYYEKFGLYKEENKKITFGTRGKVSWKSTINKSQQFYSSGNLIFTPLYVYRKEKKENFITECMKFALDYTSRNYGFILQKTTVFAETSSFDFYSNRVSVVNELKRIRRYIFKDSQKRLIKYLIEFYSEIKQSGSTHFRNYKFQHVWEDMINKYLNNYFDKVNDSGLVFKKQNIRNINFRKESYIVGKSARGNVEIKPDHYALVDQQQEKYQYIFDSKYYNKYGRVDYKQITYFEFLKNRADKTYNALILPTFGKKKNELHIKLFEEFESSTVDTKQEKLVIWNTYLNIKEVMKNYLL